MFHCAADAGGFTSFLSSGAATTETCKVHDVSEDYIQNKDTFYGLRVNLYPRMKCGYAYLLSRRKVETSKPHSLKRTLTISHIPFSSLPRHASAHLQQLRQTMNPNSQIYCRHRSILEHTIALPMIQQLSMRRQI